MKIFGTILGILLVGGLVYFFVGIPMIKMNLVDKIMEKGKTIQNFDASRSVLNKMSIPELRTTLKEL